MAYTYEQLKEMNVAQLRQIADGIEHEATKGHSTMHKEKLLPALCQALGIDSHVHHHAVGINKAKLKAEIKASQKKRDDALAAKDHKTFKSALKEIHKLKHRLRKSLA
jgi:hypothetical protein